MKTFNKIILTLILLSSSITTFASASKNPISKMISAAGAAIVVFAGISLYNSYKNKNKGKDEK